MQNSQVPRTPEGTSQTAGLRGDVRLAWRPVLEQTDLMTVAVLESLIGAPGTPLVIKNDNGWALKSGQTQKLLKRHRVVWLPSPPRTSRYNGSYSPANPYHKRIAWRRENHAGYNMLLTSVARR